MSDRVIKFGLSIDKEFYLFINSEVLPGTNIHVQQFWKSFCNLINELDPINKKLLDSRKIIQKKVQNQ